MPLQCIHQRQRGSTLPPSLTGDHLLRIPLTSVGDYLQKMDIQLVAKYLGLPLLPARQMYLVLLKRRPRVSLARRAI